MRIGVDTGGTFTDFIVEAADGSISTFKLRSNPRDPAAVILAGLDRAAGAGAATVVHGSTVATNALLERKGARTALVTTRGFEDLLVIARQNRRELYNLTPQPPRPIVPPALCFGVDERTWHDGAIARRPDPDEIAKLRRKLERARVASVAICFLHSYREPANEAAVAELLDGLGYVCASHDISPEFREYERASTTAINAYVGPLMDAYLARLESSTRRRVSVMQSNGGSLTAAGARRHAVRTILSGPAGGVIGAAEMARRSGFRRILGFDMGGTSTDVSLCDGQPRETTEAMVDGFPVRVPMLDIHTVGAGGGSIAWIDAGGLLRVGPESAGADPGPACYGKGQTATVTDAHVVLGRIAPGQFLGGELSLDRDAAHAAVARLAPLFRGDTVAAAEGIVRVANANMERAIRAVSVERGHDPRDFALAAFGGAGGLHACDLAEQLGITTVLVPRFAEALSALGMLIADAVRDYSAGVLGGGVIDVAFRDIEQTARRENRGALLERSADLRYQGQSYELNVPWTSLAAATRAFHAAHKRAYGYAAPDRAVEVVTIRVRARTPSPKLRLGGFARQAAASAPELRRVRIASRWCDIPVWHRDRMRTAVAGPALVLDYGCTTLVTPGWRGRLDSVGNLVLETGRPGTNKRRQ